MSTKIYRFQGFELDEARLELRRGGQEIPVQARVLRALIYLVQHCDHVVSKDELCDAVWQDVVVSDAALSQVIMHVRKALGDEGEQQTLLKTVRGRGFRFVAAVTTQDCAPAAPLPTLAPAPHAESGALIGRQAELRTLAAWLDAASSGRGACVLIAGEPGIGKSYIIEALTREAGSRGVDVVCGKAWEDGGTPPFWLFTQVLQALAHKHGVQALKQLAAGDFRELAGLLSTSDEYADLSPAPASGRDPRNRLALFSAVARLLRSVAARRHVEGGDSALLVILEDLQATDDASLMMLRYVSRELADSHVLIVATFRDIALGDSPELRALVDRVPAAQRLALSALQAADSALLLAQSIGEVPPPQLAAAVHELAGGNPLCIAELARHVSRGILTLPTPAGTLPEAAVPERISHAVHVQLSRLPETTQRALRCASALGRSFALPQLAQLLGQTEIGLLEQLSPALRCGLLRAAPASPTTLDFAHALVRNAVYAAQSPHERATLHRQIAELLDNNSDPALAPVHELAHHYHLAAASGGRQKAIDYALRAAAHATELRAFETAAQLHERAYALSADESASASTMFARAFEAATACYYAGQLTLATQYFDRAAQLARQQQKPQDFATCVGAACFSLRGTMPYDRARVRQIREAVRALPEGDNGIKAALLPATALGETTPNAVALRRATVDSGIAMARRIGDPAMLMHTLDCSHNVLWGAAHPAELFQIASELVELARERQYADGELLLDALVWHMLDALELGDGATLQKDMAEYTAQLDGYNSGWHRYMAAVLESVQESGVGNFAKADALSQQACQLGVQREALEQGFYAVRCMFRWLDGRTASPEPVGFPLDPPRELPSQFHALWVLVWARAGRAPQARAVLTALASRGFEHLPRDPLYRPTLALLAQAAVVLGELEHARTLYALLLPDAPLHLVLQAGVYLGPVTYTLGLVALATSDHDTALSHFEAAADGCKRANARSFLFKIYLAQAHSLIHGGARDAPAGADALGRAAQLLGQAQQLCQELGCEPWRQQAEALAAALPASS